MFAEWSKLKMVHLGLGYNKFNFFLHLWHCWFLGNGNAWDSKGPGFESVSNSFFFQMGIIPFPKKTVGFFLSSYVLSAYLPHRRSVFLLYAD